MAADAHARVCTCGHTAHWHNAIASDETERVTTQDTYVVESGDGECEANAHCSCRRFVEDKTDNYESLRGERNRARQALADLADQFHRTEHNPGSFRDCEEQSCQKAVEALR